MDTITPYTHTQMNILTSMHSHKHTRTRTHTHANIPTYTHKKEKHRIARTCKIKNTHRAAHASKSGKSGSCKGSGSGADTWTEASKRRTGSGGDCAGKQVKEVRITNQRRYPTTELHSTVKTSSLMPSPVGMVICLSYKSAISLWKCVICSCSLFTIASSLESRAAPDSSRDIPLVSSSSRDRSLCRHHKYPVRKKKQPMIRAKTRQRDFPDTVIHLLPTHYGNKQHKVFTRKEIKTCIGHTCVHDDSTLILLVNRTLFHSMMGIEQGVGGDMHRHSKSRCCIVCLTCGQDTLLHL